MQPARLLRSPESRPVETKLARRCALCLATVALLPLLAVSACNTRPVPGGGYHVNELPAEQRRVLATPRFEQYPPYHIMAPEAVAPDLSSHPKAREYRTAIRQGAERGAVFAGHVAVASWGCGANCRQWAFIDARSGAVTFGPRTSHGAAFQRDSRLFVANPPDKAPAGTEPRYFVWTGRELKPLEG